MTSRFFQIQQNWFSLTFKLKIFSERSENLFAQKKNACYLWGFWAKISKISEISRVKSNILRIKIVTSQSPNMLFVISLELHICKFSARSENLFCYRNSRNFDFQIGFSSNKISKIRMFQILHYLLPLNFICENFDKNQRTFLRAGGR